MNLRNTVATCRPDGQNSRCYVDAATTSCRSLEVVARCGASTSGTSEKESFPNPQRLASVVLLKGRAMDENKSIKTNVSFESAGLKLAGHLYTPDLDTSPSLPAIVVGPPGSSVKEQAARRRCWNVPSSQLLKIRRAQAARLLGKAEARATSAYSGLKEDCPRSPPDLLHMYVRRSFLRRQV